MKFPELTKDLAKVFGEDDAKKLIDSIESKDGAPNIIIVDAVLRSAFIWDEEKRGQKFWSDIAWRIEISDTGIADRLEKLSQRIADRTEQTESKKTCDQVNAFLSQFDCYKQADASRMAYEVKESDRVSYGDEGFGLLVTDKGEIKFLLGEKFLQGVRLVSPGDFIELIQWPHVALHWPRSQFLAQTSSENVINRGDATLETWGPGNLTVSGTVIKVGNRYFIEIKNGRVMTSPYLRGATSYMRLIDEDKKRNKALAALTARKKKPQVLEFGYWSRTVEEVQGGAA